MRSIQTSAEETILRGEPLSLNTAAEGQNAAGQGTLGIAAEANELGTISYTPKTVVKSSDSATLVFTYDDTGVSPNLQGKKITYTRDTAGNWSCSTDIDDDFTPKGCL
ncbi:pilin [Salinicola socius]|uniref:pilin n=1 Tax=Salinicola socius TaxID=404433 RepID=UPI003CC6A66B